MIMKSDINDLERELEESYVGKKVKQYDESAGMICFRYGMAGVAFVGVVGVAVKGVGAMLNDELVSRLRNELLSDWSDEGFNTFMNVNYVYAPVGVVASLGLGYLVGKRISNGIKRISEKVH